MTDDPLREDDPQAGTPDETPPRPTGSTGPDPTPIRAAGPGGPPRGAPAAPGAPYPGAPYPGAPFQGAPYGRPYPPRPARRSPLPWILLALGLVAVGGCGFMMLIAAASGASGSGANRKLTEETVQDEGEDKIALIELEGVIAPAQGGGLFGGAMIDPVERMKRQLAQAEQDEHVKAVLLAIDSPGGAVTTSDQLHHLVQTFRQRSQKPVVVHMGALCASGGVYVAVAADKLVCEPTTITGSIGVILSGLNYHDLLEKYGVQDVTITSGPNKALLNPTSPVREEHLKILQSMVDENYDRFVQLVAEGRHLEEDVVRKIADGRIYTANQALELKLVDQIGYREDALALARKEAGISGGRLIRYTSPPTLADVLSGNVRVPLTIGSRIDPAVLLDELASPRLLALWRPH